jgi:hypothetical protein
MLRVAAVSTRDRQVCAGTMYFGGVLGRDTHLAKAGMYRASLKYCCSLLLLFVLQNVFSGRIAVDHTLDLLIPQEAYKQLRMWKMKSFIQFPF